MTVAALAIYWTVIRTPTRNGAGGQDHADEVAVTALPLDERRARQRPVLLRRDQVLPTASGWGPSEGNPRSDPDERGANDTAPDALIAIQRERYRRAEDAFSAQRRDPTWAAHAEAAARRALATHLDPARLSGRLGAVQCRASWCAIDVVNPVSVDLPIVDDSISDVARALSATEGKVLESRLSLTRPDGRLETARYYLRFSRS